MPRASRSEPTTTTWTPTPDPDEKFSSGTPDLDRLLGGGFPRGCVVLIEMDPSLDPSDWKSLLTPTFLNFLYQSRGVMTVLPARESPHAFRADLSRWVSRRRFDSRVRIIDYVGEDDEAPYVVGLKSTGGHGYSSPAAKKAKMEKDMARMQAAEVAVRGARAHPFIETVAVEIMEMVVGAEKASRMFLHGFKRTRMVGNLGFALLRPGLGCADAVRGMADLELALHRTELGLTVRGVRPAFTGHLVITDARQGPPHLSFIPAP
jgi:hypothetical protein